MFFFKIRSKLCNLIKLNRRAINNCIRLVLRIVSICCLTKSRYNLNILYIFFIKINSTAPINASCRILQELPSFYGFKIDIPNTAFLWTTVCWVTFVNLDLLLGFRLILIWKVTQEKAKFNFGGLWAGASLEKEIN